MPGHRGCPNASAVHRHHCFADVNNDTDPPKLVTEGQIWSIIGVGHDVGWFKHHINTSEFGRSHKLADNAVMPPDPQTGTMVASQSVVAEDIDTRKVGFSIEHC